jgi:propionyl-CoA carboxylase beta chain
MTDPTRRVDELDLNSTQHRLSDLAARREEAVDEAEKRARDRQHGRGKLTARERIGLLFDEGSFVELDQFVRHRFTDYGMAGNRPYGDGVITGYGTVDGRRVCAYSHDFTAVGGSMGEAFGEKVLKVVDLAVKTGCPLVQINDSGGARIQEGVVALAFYASVGRRMVAASGAIPQISVVMGPCAGGSAYGPALTDVTVMVDGTSYMFVTGPEVVSAVTGERTTIEELGGATVNANVSGNAHYVASDDRDAITWVRSLLSYLPSNSLETPPLYGHESSADVTESDRELDTFLPDSRYRAYDMHDIIRRVVDGGEMLPVQAGFAPNMICLLATVDGQPVGVVANQPTHLAGAIDIDASDKASRFVRFCDAFNLPIVTFVDVPGYLPGIDQERDGIIRHGAKMIYAYSEATVPMVTVVVGKAYGGGYAVMGSKHFGADINLAWPTAEIAVMGAQAAVPLLHRKDLAAVAEEDRAALRKKLTDEYQLRFNTPYVAADRGYIDAVIQPSETRSAVARALHLLRDKRAEPALPKKHGNIPL